MARSKRGATAGISDEAVENKTGRPCRQWCRILDAAGGRDRTPKELVALVMADNNHEPFPKDPLMGLRYNFSAIPPS